MGGGLFHGLMARKGKGMGGKRVTGAFRTNSWGLLKGDAIARDAVRYSIVNGARGLPLQSLI